jgi:Anti-sigma-K factor rskA, C-terminal
VSTIDANEAHERWTELAAGHVLSSLDDADEALYLQHAAQCPICQELEREFSGALSDLAQLPARVTPPPSLKASIMRAVIEDDELHTAPVVSISGRRSVVDLTRMRSRARSTKAVWWAAAAAAAAVLVVVAGVFAWSGAGEHKQPSVAARCAAVHCPTVPLTADGKYVATVMVLDDVAYVQADGLPKTPPGHSYVLWSLSPGRAPVGVAAVRTAPTAGPVKAGAFTTPISQVASFALSEESGDAVPAAPTDVIANGNLA